MSRMIDHVEYRELLKKNARSLISLNYDRKDLWQLILKEYCKLVAKHS